MLFFLHFGRLFLGEAQFLLLAWCAAPMQANGSNMIFGKLFAGKIFKEPPVMSGGLAPPAAGGKKESPDTSRKMKK